LSNINNSVEEDIEKVILDSSSKSKKIKTKLQIQEDDKSSLNNNQLETTILPDSNKSTNNLNKIKTLKIFRLSSLASFLQT